MATRQEAEQVWRDNVPKSGECDSMIFYDTWMDALLECDDDKELAAAVRFMFGYVRLGIVPTYDTVAKMPTLRYNGLHLL